MESSKEDDLVTKQKTHTLKVSVGRKEDDDMTLASPDKKRGRNAIMRALNKKRNAALLELNAATNQVPEIEDLGFSEATGLNKEQRKILETTKCLFRYNDGWRVYWDLFIMFLAIWNCFIIPVEVAFEPDALTHPIFIVSDALIDF